MSSNPGPSTGDDRVDLVVIAAHPDDAELAIGGTLLMAREIRRDARAEPRD